MVEGADGGSWRGVQEAAALLGISVSTLRRRLKLGTVTARREHGRYGDEWQIWVADDRRPATAPAGDPGHGERGERSQVDTDHGYEQRQADHTQAESTLELVRLVARLQEENRNLAGQLGYVQAQLEQYKALMAPAEPAPEGALHQSAPEGQQGASVAGVAVDDVGPPAAPARKPWWRFW